MYKIYTDGACSKNPGPGAWAFLVLKEGIKTPIYVSSQFEEMTTNNRMELKAATIALNYALSFIPIDDEIILYTDSMYVKSGVVDWVKRWKANGWKTSKNEPVKNRELWEQLVKVSSRFSNLKWAWVKAHHEDEYNLEVDRLARAQLEKNKK